MTLIDTRREAPASSPRAETGLWLFILLDLTIFTTFFATALYYRAIDPAAYQHSQAALSVEPALLNTFVLLTGSLFVVRGVQAARRGQFHTTRSYLVLAALCGCCFIAVKAFEYTRLIADGHTIQTNAFFLCYFAFTLIHLTHVCIGTIALAWVARVIPHRNNIIWVLNSGNYWHMVDLLWLLLFPVLYLV